MQHTSDDVHQKQRALRKKDQKGLARDLISKEKSQPCLQNEHQSGPTKDDTINVSRSFEPSKFAVERSNKDILCGRGKSFFNHEGNKRFRDIIDKYRDPYRKASRRSGKSEIVNVILHETLETGARFLKRSKNKLEWYDVGGKVAKEKVGHALRDATSENTQSLSKKKHFLHDQKKRQQTIKGKELTSESNGSMVETLESDTVSFLPYDSLLERKEANEKPMQTRSRQSPCCEDAQMLTMKNDNQISFEVEDSIFSEATLNNDYDTVISENQKYASIKSNDGIGKASLGKNGKTNISPPFWNSYAECEEQIDPVLRLLQFMINRT